MNVNVDSFGRNKLTGKIDYPTAIKVEGSTYVVDWNTKKCYSQIKKIVQPKIGYASKTSDAYKKDSNFYDIIKIGNYVNGGYYQFQVNQYPIQEAHVLHRTDIKREERRKRQQVLHLSKTEICRYDKEHLFKIAGATLNSMLKNRYLKFVVNEKGERRQVLAEALKWDVKNGGICLIPIEDKCRAEIMKVLSKGIRKRNHTGVK